MQIYLLGLSHNTAGIDQRERLAFTEGQSRAALSDFVGRKYAHGIQELILLSTCNRTELYAVGDEHVSRGLEAFLTHAKGLTLSEVKSYLYRHENMEAARHLFHVAAGLDSLVLGEPQVLGQVSRALDLAREQDAAGPMLNRLFQSAIRAGKRARSETAIARHPASVASLAASTAERIVPQISAAQVVILGAGETAELAVEALRVRGANHILVIGRSLERARRLAHKWEAQAGTFDSIHSALFEADILISSTDAPHMLISQEMVAAAMAQRPDRPLMLLDIAVPRDIGPGCASLPGVQLWNLDALNTRLEWSLAERQAEVPRVRAILEEELGKFAEYLNSVNMLPVIAHLRQQAEVIRRDVVEKTMRRMPDLNDSERERIEAMTRTLVKKLLEAPTHRLRAEAASSDAAHYAAVTRTLFGLDGNGRALPSSSE